MAIRCCIPSISKTLQNGFFFRGNLEKMEGGLMEGESLDDLRKKIASEDIYIFVTIPFTIYLDI